MREIKFRAWDGEKKRMLYGFDVNEHHAKQCPHWWGFDSGYIGDEEVFRVKYMQYTGLKDKHGKEIYEGDIVQNDDMSDGAVGVVEFRDGCFLDTKNWYEEHNNIYAKNSEIIGNIYENPELVEQDRDDAVIILR